MAVFRSDKETINGLRRLIDRLQLENKILTDRVNAYESDRMYEKLREDYEGLLREKDHEIQRLKKEKDILRGEIRKIKKIWM